MRSDDATTFQLTVTRSEITGETLTAAGTRPANRNCDGKTPISRKHMVGKVMAVQPTVTGNVSHNVVEASGNVTADVVARCTARMRHLRTVRFCRLHGERALTVNVTPTRRRQSGRIQRRASMTERHEFGPRPRRRTARCERDGGGSGAFTVKSVKSQPDRNVAR